MPEFDEIGKEAREAKQAKKDQSGAEGGDDFFDDDFDFMNDLDDDADFEDDFDDEQGSRFRNFVTASFNWIKGMPRKFTTGANKEVRSAWRNVRDRIIVLMVATGAIWVACRGLITLVQTTREIAEEPEGLADGDKVTLENRFGIAEDYMENYREGNLKLASFTDSNHVNSSVAKALGAKNGSSWFCAVVPNAAGEMEIDEEAFDLAKDWLDIDESELRDRWIGCSQDRELAHELLKDGGASDRVLRFYGKADKLLSPSGIPGDDYLHWNTRFEELVDWVDGHGSIQPAGKGLGLAKKVEPETEKIGGKDLEKSDEVAENVVQEVLETGLGIIKIGKEISDRIVEVAKDWAINNELPDVNNGQDLVNFLAGVSREVVDKLKNRGKEEGSQELRGEIHQVQMEANPMYGDLAQYDLGSLDTIGEIAGFGLGAGSLLFFVATAGVLAVKFYRRELETERISFGDLRADILTTQAKENWQERPGMGANRVVVGDLRDEVTGHVEGKNPFPAGVSLTAARKSEKIEGADLFFGEKVLAEIVIKKEEAIEMSDVYNQAIKLVTKGISRDFWQDFITSRQLKPNQETGVMTVSAEQLVDGWNKWVKSHKVKSEDRQLKGAVGI